MAPFQKSQVAGAVFLVLWPFRGPLRAEDVINLSTDLFILQPIEENAGFFHYFFSSSLTPSLRLPGLSCVVIRSKQRTPFLPFNWVFNGTVLESN